MGERDDFEDEFAGGGDADGGGDPTATAADDLAAAFAHDEDDEDVFTDDPEGVGADDEDDDDDDDDEGAEVRTAVLWKREMLALLSLKTGARGGLIVRVDPRQPLPSAQTYEDSDAALRWFRRSLATSRRNGWQVVYAGTPLFG